MIRIGFGGDCSIIRIRFWGVLLGLFIKGPQGNTMSNYSDPLCCPTLRWASLPKAGGHWHLGPFGEGTCGVLKVEVVSLLL